MVLVSEEGASSLAPDLCDHRRAKHAVSFRFISLLLRMRAAAFSFVWSGELTVLPLCFARQVLTYKSMGTGGTDRAEKLAQS